MRSSQIRWLMLDSCHCSWLNTLSFRWIRIVQRVMPWRRCPNVGYHCKFLRNYSPKEVLLPIKNSHSWPIWPHKTRAWWAWPIAKNGVLSFIDALVNGSTPCFNAIPKLMFWLTRVEAKKHIVYRWKPERFAPSIHWLGLPCAKCTTWRQNLCQSWWCSTLVTSKIGRYLRDSLAM